MEELDGRRLSHDTLEEMRVRAVKAVLNDESPERVIKAMDLSRQWISVWLAAYQEEVFKALKAKGKSERQDCKRM
jgi:transposase